MAAILRIKNPETGEFEDIKALVGPKGPKGDTPPLSNIAPSSLGVASPGTATNASREDHVHPMPTANDVGALPVDGTAEDSSKLNGQEASYYATEEEVSQLKNEMGLKMDLLWTNASPTSEFKNQTINLDLSNYKFVYIELRYYAYSYNYYPLLLNKINYERIPFASIDDARVIYRTFNVTDNGIIVGDALYIVNYGEQPTIMNNNIIIPYMIYGVR